MPTGILIGISGRNILAIFVYFIYGFFGGWGKTLSEDQRRMIR